jgi:hypothetical protein
MYGLVFVMALVSLCCAEGVERVYLHLDKPYYAAGEYAWFRAYLVDEALDMEGVESRIVRVELSDGMRNVVARTLLYSDSAEYAGGMLLPDSLPSGNYHLRAYTRAMRNGGEDSFFHRDIYVNNSDATRAEARARARDYEVGFFPEGGGLLEGGAGEGGL